MTQGGIKKRNLDKKLVQWIMNASGRASGPLTGQERYVIRSGATAMDTWIREHVDNTYIHSTLDVAISACTASRGDTIFVLPNHTESLTGDSAVDADVAGINIIGLGQGEQRPIFTFTTATTADFKIAAANILIHNLVFKCNIANQAMMIEVTGDDAEISHCEFREGSTTGLNFITLGASADNDADRAYIHDCKFYMPTSGNGDSAISIAYDMTGVKISDCYIYGNFDLAGIDIPTGGNAQVDCVIKDCDVTNLQSGQHAIQVNGTSSTGRIQSCKVITDAYAAAIDAGGLVMINNEYHDFVDQSAAIPFPVDDSSEGSGDSTPATKYYVDASVSASGSGMTWDTAFKTIDEAVAVATTRFDEIHVAAGDYDEGNVVNLTTQGLKMVGHEGVDNHNKAMIWSGSASHLMTINNHEITIDGIGFSAPDDTKDAIRIGTTTASYKVTIKNCRFDGWSGEHGIYADNDNPDLLIEDCLFRSWNTAAIHVNCTRAMIRRNTFHLVAGKIGIKHQPTGGGRPDTVIKDNVIKGVNSTDTGISITNTPDENALVIQGNSVINCATPVTAQRYTSWYDGNYWGINDADYHAGIGDSGGRVFYVNANAGTTGLDGRSRKSAFLTLTEANAVATTRNDTIYMADGDYDEGAVVNITTQGLRIIGEGPKSGYHNKAMIYSGSASHLMTINKHEVVIDNVHFSMPDDGYDAVRVGTTAASYKVTIRNCRFDGWSGEYGIYTSTDCPDLLIEDCLFRSWNTAAIYMNVTRGMVRRCIFHVVTDKIGIEHIPNGGDRPDAIYMDNTFSGVANSSTTGIKFTGSPSNGTITIVRNIFSGTWDTTITQIAAWGGVENYAATAAGGALIDTVTA